jgi:hypothetical protein
MNETPSFIPAWKAARARGDEEAANDVLRRAAAYRKAHPKKEPPQRPDCRGDLTWARVTNDVPAAKKVIADAVKQREAHTLAAEDLIWVAERLGPIRPAGWVAEAIAEWIYRHGPTNAELIGAAEEVARGDNSAHMDEVLLWVEPTPDRWIQYGLWVRVHIDWGMADQLKQAGKAMPDRLTDPDDIALYKSLVGTPDHVEHVLAERGEAARQSLAKAAQQAGVGSTVRCVLEVWAEKFG